MTGQPISRTDSELAVILLNQSGEIVDAHATCLDALGWERDELIGKDIRVILQNGRELLLSQVAELECGEGEGHTSSSIRVLAKRKDQSQFPARATVRRFNDLDCWTVAFYPMEPGAADPEAPPAVSAEEIALAKRALDESTPAAAPARSWRNSRLLFSFHKNKTASAETPAAARPASAPEAEIVPVQPPKPVEKPAPLSPAVEPVRPAVAVSGEPDVIAKVRAELEKERADRARFEQRAASLSSQVQTLHLQLSENLKVESENEKRIASLERDLREAQEAAARASTESSEARREKQLLAEELLLIQELNTKLEQHCARFAAVKTDFDSAREQSRQQLETANETIRDFRARLERESAKRQHLELSLANAFRERCLAQESLQTERSEAEALCRAAELERDMAREEARKGQAELLRARREMREQFSHGAELSGEPERAAA